MSGPGGGDDDLDPDILEELEFWGGTEPPGPVPEEPPPPPAAKAEGAGTVVLVGTPIGNLGDLSPRAVQALASADVIYCEDTRHSRKLLTHAGISGVALRSLHEHNEDDRIDEVLASVRRGAGRWPWSAMRGCRGSPTRETVWWRRWWRPA